MIITAAQQAKLCTHEHEEDVFECLVHSKMEWEKEKKKSVQSLEWL